MRPGISYMTLLLILILSTGSGSTYSQNSAKQDSTKAAVKDIKQTNGLLLELEYRRGNDSTWNLISGIKDEKLLEKDNQISLLQKSLNEWKNFAEENQPPWFDHYWIGALSVLILFTTLILVVK